VPVAQFATTIVAGALGAGLAIALVGASLWLALPALVGVTAASLIAGRGER
jgi:hypothetical protein